MHGDYDVNDVCLQIKQFNNGDVADADDVNNNFNNLKYAIENIIVGPGPQGPVGDKGPTGDQRSYR